MRLKQSVIFRLLIDLFSNFLFMKKLSKVDLLIAKFDPHFLAFQEKRKEEEKKEKKQLKKLDKTMGIQKYYRHHL